MNSGNGQTVDRILVILLALIPAALGVFAFMNNITDWSGSVERVAYPLVSMQGADVNAAQKWRAIDSPLFANGVYLIIITMELATGLWALRGVIGLVGGVNAPSPHFLKYTIMVKRAAILGAIIYCLLFFTIGGDWFLAWKNDSLDFLQRDSLNYATVFTIVVLLIRNLESDMQKK